MAYEEPDDSGESENEESFPYPKLDDLMKELKDKRKQIEQQRLEEIKAKKLEQGELIDESAEEGKDDKKDTEKNKESDFIQMYNCNEVTIKENRVQLHHLFK